MSDDIIKSVFRDMTSANRKAEQYLFEYNERIAYITETETEKGKEKGLSNIFIAERIKSKKENDEEAGNYFRAYSFWKGEIERYSAVLQGIAAYKQLTYLVPSPLQPIMPFDPSGE